MDTSKLTQFHKDLAEWGITLTSKQDEQFIKFYELLVEWNSFMNLTAITEFDEVMKKHFLDSMSFVHYVKNYYCITDNKITKVNKDIVSNDKGADAQKEFDCSYLSQLKFTMIDVGTGAGFPGIPLAILFPEAKFTLMDSLNKRIKFLNEVILQIGLTNVETVHSRAEDLARNAKYREQYDYAVSRAVANLSTLSEYCLPYVDINGMFIPYKSGEIDEEVEESKKAVHILGGKMVDVVKFQLPGTEIGRSFVKVRKIANTNKKYPRKVGLPAKEPLG